MWLNRRSSENEPDRTRLGGSLTACSGVRSILITSLPPRRGAFSRAAGGIAGREQPFAPVIRGGCPETGFAEIMVANAARSHCRPVVLSRHGTGSRLGSADPRVELTRDPLGGSAATQPTELPL